MENEWKIIKGEDVILYMSRQLSCCDMYKIVTWLDH